MTNEEAMNCAKALHDFCRDSDCNQCPFGKPSEWTDRIICKITDYQDPPCGWELDEFGNKATSTSLIETKQ